MPVTEDSFGNVLNPLSGAVEPVRRFTVSNANEISFQIITYGATLTSLMLPDKEGEFADVLLGYDNIDGYLTPTNPYIGCTVGRVCSRVGNGKFILDGQEIEVTKNFLDKHQLHGGMQGFSKVNWEVDEEGVHEDGVTLKLTSPDGHEGYPGEVQATATYSLTDNNCLVFCLEAITDKPTPVNMTNHAYFNLAGHNTGLQGMSEHEVLIRADQITDMDEETVPNGEFISLDNHPLDLRRAKNVGQGLEEIAEIAKGYDHNYVLDYKVGSITSQAKAIHVESGRYMEISSNMPCMHFYTSHNMPNISEGEEATIIGKGNTAYEKYGGFCMETHWYPDAMNHESFPPIFLNPEEKYSHTCVFKFDVKNARDWAAVCC